ncbi:hypothetical protein, partial [Nonomuraea pusilla]|uniref:hypothetical protein n=1 Tax=Nonomuraea pusilla TaxID=46177 RepID=UPI001C435345
ALTELVRALANLGEHDRAETVARSITDPGSQAWALTELVRALANLGEHDRAEAVARSITDSLSQAKAIASIVNRNYASRSRQLLAWGLSRLNHVDLLGSIARIEPAAVRRLAQAMGQADRQLR